jgi:hypothetical protein
MAISVRFIRRCADGRWQVECLNCGNVLYLTPSQLFAPPNVCPYCARAWQFNGRSPGVGDV